MKYKYGLIGICLFICLFSIASISAADVNGTAIQTDNNIDNTVALDNNVQDSNIGTGPDDVTSTNDKDYILSSSSFLDIQKMIDDAVEGSEINLTTDYSLASGGDTIKISKSITIHGNGHTLDGHHLKRIVSIEANSKNIVFDNIKFVNGGSKQSSSGDLFEGILTAKDVAYNDDYGGAIYYMYNEENDKKGSTFNDDIGEGGAATDGPMPESSSLTITNCEFRSNGVKYCGGAIYIGAGDQLSAFGWPEDGDALLSIGRYGNLSVDNCKFYDNVAQSRNGGAIFSDHNYIFINNTEFKANHVDHRENIFAEAFGMNSYYYAAGSAVTKVYRPLSGGAIYSRPSCNIYNSKFEGNKVGNGGLMTQVGTSGGAIHCRGELDVYNTTFNSNAVNDYGGGAIFAEKYTNIYNSTFENNTAVKGGAIYSFKLLNVYNSTFKKNRHIIGTAFTEDLNLPKVVKDAVGEYIKPIKEAGLDFSSFVSSEGGAICTRHSCNIESCHFEENYACEKGGAIYCEGILNINGTDNYFIRNEAYRDGQSLTELFASSIKNLIHNQDGGAIYCKNNMEVYNATFIRNSAVIDGGAVYCERTSSLYNTKFEENFLKGIIARGSYGGAICTEKLDIADNCSFKKNNADTSSNMGLFSKGGAVYIGESCKPEFVSCNFNDNNVRDDGGAIYVNSKETHLKLSNCYFDGNEGDLDGGAVFCTGMTSVSNSIFSNNKATGDVLLLRSYGGAIRSKKFIDITNSTFNKNFADNWGGAVYADDGIDIKDSNFTSNSAKNAGAVYTSTTHNPITNCIFKDNKATNGDGGAVHVYNKCNPKFVSCIFEQNSATSDGGAIYLASARTYLGVTDSIFNNNKAGDCGGAIYAPSNIYNSNMELGRCHFTENTAKKGGAIYASAVNKMYNSEFVGNKATSGDGGAIYINNKCDPKFESCRFTENTCRNRGGAIYLDSIRAHLKMSYCTLTNNFAEKKSHPGHTVYNSGYYDSVDLCWFGKNNPNFKDVLVEYHALKEDTYHTPSNYLETYLSINGIQTKDVYKDTPYNVAINFYASNGKTLDRDLLHAPVRFIIGSAGTVSNINNGMYKVSADVVFTVDKPLLSILMDSHWIIHFNARTKESTEAPVLSYSNEGYYDSAKEITPVDELLGINDDMEIDDGEYLKISFFDHIDSKHSDLISYFSYQDTGKLILSVNETPRFTKDFNELDQYLHVYLYDLNITADGIYDISAEYIVGNTSEKIDLGHEIVNVTGVDWDSDEYVSLFPYVDILNKVDYFIDIENNGEYVNGTVFVYVDGDLKLTKNVVPEDEKVFFEINVVDLGLYNNITLGNHTVKVDYIKNNKEKHEVEKSIQFYAEPDYVHDFIISETEKDVMEIKYIKGFEGNATLYYASMEESNQSGHYEWIKGDVYKSANFTDGIAIIYLEGLSAGEKYFILNITDYDLEKHVYVTVKKNSPEISASISPSETTFGNNFTVKFNGAKTDDKLYFIVDDLDFVNLPLTNGTLDDIIWGLGVGDHRIKLVYDNGVDFNGTEFYSNTFFVTVKEAPAQAKIKLTLKSIPVYKYAEKAVLQATLKKGKSALKSKIVKFKFNGKTYKAKTNSKGIAKVTIKKSVLKKLKVGKKITYQASYGKKTVKKTVKVKKEAPKTTLTLKKANVKKSAKNALLQAILKKGKSALKSKTVKFKFNGKTYKANTNSKGIAKVTIKKSVLKKLKVGKKITYQASYGKITVKKTVKVIK